MKKTVSVLLVLVICMSICACGSGGTSLTLTNYKEYFNFTIDDMYQTRSVDIGHWGTWSRNTDLYFKVWSRGASSNFNYNNVKIKVRIYGSYGLADLKSISDSPSETRNFEIIVELSPNISGLAAGGVESQRISGNGKAIVTCNYQYEIVSISGTITPA